jgi:hypothetical protein
VYDVTEFYHETGMFGWLARQPYFENVSLSAVVANSVWIAVEIDYDKSTVISEADPIFQVVAHLFCAFFSWEVFVRFGAFRRKFDAFKDMTFVFDFTLALLAVIDTWIVTAAVALLGLRMGGGKIFLIFKILRVAKLLRLGKVVRCFPDLLVILRGITMAVRSVGVIVLLLAFIIYVSAIIFRVLLEGTDLGTLRFNNMGQAMGTLLLDCTLSGSKGTHVMKEADEEHLIYSGILLMYVVFANITVMGVLGGSLVQAIKTVAEVEKAENAAKVRKNKMEDLWYMIVGADIDNDGYLSEIEVRTLLDAKDDAVSWQLKEMGVDVESLQDTLGFLLMQNGGIMTGDLFKKTVLELQTKKFAMVRDHVVTRKFFYETIREFEERIKKRS